MKNVDITDGLLFGAPDARNPAEQNGLKEYFLNPPGYSGVLGGQQTIVVGRKGTGKTAIRTKLLELWDSIIHVDVEPLLPNHKIFGLYSEMVEGSTEPSFATYEYAWRAYVLACTLRKLVDESKLGFSDRKTLRQYLPSFLGESKENSLMDRIREISLGVTDIVNISVKIDAPTVRRGLPNEQEIPILTDVINRACLVHRTNINVYVDRIDQQLEEPLIGDLFNKYSKYIGGACLASARIAGHGWSSNGSKWRLRLYIFARSDLLDVVRPTLHSVSEFEGLIYSLNWRMETLMDLMGARLCRATGESYEPGWPYDMKRSVFSDKMLFKVFQSMRPDGYHLWKYMLVHTHMRPRDLIGFCNKARVEAVNGSKKYINDSALNSGVHGYSQMRYEELVSGERWLVSNFQKLIDSFQVMPLVFTQDNLRRHLLEKMKKLHVFDIRESSNLDPDLPQVEEMIRTLFRAGFLVAPSGTDRSLPFVAHYIDPHLGVTYLSKLMVHPAFFRAIQKGKTSANVKQVIEGASIP